MFANYQGIHIKSGHEIRKTYAGNLNACGVPLDCIVIVQLYCLQLSTNIIDTKKRKPSKNRGSPTF